jgi:nucleoside-diphosphate-sugar epimerase
MAPHSDQEGAAGAPQVSARTQSGAPARPLVLVTGLSGFTGRHLRPALQARGWRVVGVDHREPDAGSASSPSGAALDESRHCDLLDRQAVAALVQELQPRAVIHLAGIASVTHGDVGEIYRVNIMGTRNLLEALAAASSQAAESPGSGLRTVVLASTANIYGNTGGHALDESTPSAPTNDYAVSKLAMEYMALTFRERLPITIVRPFNYTGPGQSDRFVIPKIVGHFRRRAQVLELGNMDVTREFSDVRRVVEAYARLIDLPGTGQVYNLASGSGVTLREVIDILERISGHKIELRFNSAFARANEVRILVGSCARIESVIGALPRYTIEDTLGWMLETE